MTAWNLSSRTSSHLATIRHTVKRILQTTAKKGTSTSGSSGYRLQSPVSKALPSRKSSASQFTESKNSRNRLRRRRGLIEENLDFDGIAVMQPGFLLDRAWRDNFEHAVVVVCPFEHQNDRI